MEYLHIYPTNDLIEHETDEYDPPCQCNPKYNYDFDSDSCLIIHAAMDRREVFEKSGLVAPLLDRLSKGKFKKKD